MSDEQQIRDTYASYSKGGRTALWSPSNAGYARLSRDRDAELERLLGASLGDGSGTFLDVGCGDGTLAAAVSARWPRVAVIGVDLLDEHIGLARARVPMATFALVSAERLPVASQTVDVVSAITVFSSMPSRRMEDAVAREIARVLRPGGWLIWYDLRYSNPSNPAVHGVSRARLEQLFPGWRRELHTITLAPPIARGLGLFTPALYGLLHHVPALRSHLVGRLQCPD